MVMSFEARHVGRTIRTVVVGVDGSVESMSALEWAGRVIEPGGVIHAVAAISPAYELAIAAVQINSAKVIEKLTRNLETSWTAALRADGHNVVCHVIEDDAADALLVAGTGVGADLIVVGVHSKPKHAPRTLGRVTAKLIHQTDRPLAVVDDNSDTLEGGTTVVAHAGHGVAMQAAVRWAAGFADVQRAGLSLIRSTPHRPSLGPDGLLDVLAFYIDPSMLRQWAADDLTQLADEIQQSTEHQLRITWSSTTGASGPQMIEASTEAALIVVGRNTSAGRSHVIPSALRHVIVHAPCPVVVVPPVN